MAALAAAHVAAHMAFLKVTKMVAACVVMVAAAPWAVMAMVAHMAACTFLVVAAASGFVVP